MRIKAALQAKDYRDLHTAIPLLVKQAFPAQPPLIEGLQTVFGASRFPSDPA